MWHLWQACLSLSAGTQLSCLLLEGGMSMVGTLSSLTAAGYAWRSLGSCVSLLSPGRWVQVRAEKPTWYLAVISGALLRTLDFVAARSAEYLGYLEKGQLPPARLTLTAFEEAFVLEGASAGRLASGYLWCSMNDASMLCFFTLCQECLMRLSWF